MGTQFSWFYDILLVAILLGVTYGCTRKGFAAGVINFVGTLLGFALALFVSGPAAAQIYDNFISPGIVLQMTYTTSNNLPENGAITAFETLREVDMSKARINNIPFDDFILENNTPEGDTMKLELMAVNMLDTGIVGGDLTFFGLDTDYDFRYIDVGYIDITAAERASHDIKDIILARIVSYRISDKAEEKYKVLDSNLIAVLPGVARTASGTVDVVGRVLLAGIEHDAENLAVLVDTHMVRPVTIIPFRMFVFALVFALISVVVSAVAKSQDFADRFTLAGKVNTALGLIMGIAFSGIIAAVLVVAVSIIVALTGDTVIFLNTMTVSQTYVFKYLYGVEFLNFKMN